MLLSSLATLLLGAGCVREQYFQPDARPDTSLPLPATADSVRTATAGRQYARHNGIYLALVGRHHRSVWAAPVAAPVLRLSQAQPDGLRPGKIGGGFNSTSLGLTATDGRLYVLRTVDKDPIRAMPEWLRGTFLVNILRDNVSSTNPYAALTVPPLAAAVGVPHATPQLYYVRPDDPVFRSDSLRHFRGQLAYLEEKAAVPVDGLPGTSIVSSKAAFAAVFKNPAHRLDQPALLRARLLDGWLGDWDRHPGQWNWAENPANEAEPASISPLPKDRDIVFYRLDDGVLGWIITHFVQPHWTTFGPHFKKPLRLLSSGHYLDTRGLNSLTRHQFQTTARAMQQLLPDTLISRAVRRLPLTAFTLEGPRTIAALQARRTALPALADGLYQALARRPVIGGTAQAERFEVHRYPDSTVVAVFQVQPGASVTAQPFYHRAFFRSETRRIQLEGLGGDDVFIIEEHGINPASQPKIRIYGGTGTDELRGKPYNRSIRFLPESAPAKNAYDKPPKE